MNIVHYLPRSVLRWSSPKGFHAASEKWLPRLALSAIGMLIIGLAWGLLYAPADYQQGDSFRIIYVHVPAAAFSLSVYVAMALSAAVGLIWHIKLSFMVARSCAIVGTALTFLALATGSLWGKPMWGTWWIWDARLTSQLILLFLYLGYLGLHSAIPHTQTADKACALLAVVGVINVPIIHYSVEWWNTLHQGATVFKFSKPSIAPAMLWPLLVMMAAYALVIVTLVILWTRNEILARQIKELQDL